MYSKSTELSKNIWDLKDRTINPIVNWSIAEKIYSNTKLNYCKLCLLKKLYIIDFIENRLLNKRNEFISGCKHHNKLLLYIFIYACTVRTSRHNNQEVSNVQLKIILFFDYIFDMINMFSTEFSVLWKTYLSCWKFSEKIKYLLTLYYFVVVMSSFP